MMLHICFLDVTRRSGLAAYVDDISAALSELKALLHTTEQWHSKLGAEPTSTAEMTSHLARHQMRDELGQPIQDMGVSARFFLPATTQFDVYATFHVDVSSPYATERVILEIDSSLLSWQSFQQLFVRGINRWNPKTADIMNATALSVLSEELAGKIPVGFARYRFGAFVSNLPELATSVDLDTGTAVFLRYPAFDWSLEEATKLQTIAELFT